MKNRVCRGCKKTDIPVEELLKYDDNPFLFANGQKFFFIHEKNCSWKWGGALVDNVENNLLEQIETAPARNYDTRYTGPGGKK